MNKKVRVKVRLKRGQKRLPEDRKVGNTGTSFFKNDQKRGSKTTSKTTVKNDGKKIVNPRKCEAFSANDNAGYLGSCGKRAVSMACPAAPAAGQG
jgi:hypothetical protein